MLSQFLESLREGESQEEDRGRHAAVAQQAVSFDASRERGDSESLPSYGAAGAGRKTEDLFLYPVEDVSLDKGERGYYPLFSAQVPYEHVYQWQIPDYVNEENYHRTHRDEEKPETEIVWHSVRLDNNTDTPWTTAPAETIRKGQILGQDMLAYTPPGGQQTVRITKAVSVDVNERELEVEREREAKTLYHDEFDRVTIEGRLKASNLKNKKITLEITKMTSAEKIKSTTGDPELKTLARGLRNLNSKRELKWRITLKPEESRKLNYRYTVLVEY